MMNQRITCICFLLAVLLAILSLPVSSESNTLPDTEYPQWRASVSAPDCTGPIDPNNSHWYEPDFDDSTWEVISPPLINDIAPSEDRFYRTVYASPLAGNVYLNVASDDGIWIYINGQFIGHWGGECHEPGCVGDVPWECEVGAGWLNIDVTQYLQPGQSNVIAAHVSNYAFHGDNWSYFSLVFFPELLAFDLPISYEGRAESNREGFYQQFQFQMTSLFDHSPDGDEILRPFNGDRLANPGGNCELGVDCYDGHLGWDFDDKNNQTDVYAAAEGDIVPEETGCSSSDGLGCRVCIRHGNTGYSTIYGHLRSYGFLTTGHVTKKVQIGIIGNTGNSTGSHLHFGTFYDPSSDCEFDKEVDPSGWLSISEPDPREVATGLKSIPLWIHPLSASTLAQPGAPAVLSWHDLGTRIEIQANSYTETLRMTLVPAPNPATDFQLAGTGHGFYLTAADSEGNEVSLLNLPMQLQISFDSADLTEVWPDTVSIYQYDYQSQEWAELPTVRNHEPQMGGTSSVLTVAYAETQQVAPFTLLGLRKHVIFLPTVIKY
jgi:hypothetical protein